ncbi:MAG: DUF2169 domain-containing protein [Gemmatimonadetes bacterium]|nr:DUF2169 domain-containing protein [Gemmatimonadota bacterium]
MLQFRNLTGLGGMAFGAPDPDGVDSLYAVIKGTFDVVTGESAEEQLPVVVADEHYGDPATSSIRAPSDISLVKPATDVLLVGSAHAPGGRPAAYVDVSLRVGPVGRTVRVFGDRYWVSSGAGVTPTYPEPFQVMPLVWERAYGGTERVGDRVDGEARNPVGTGFRAEGSEAPLHGLKLPNLEDPYDPITSWKQRPQPAGFAPLAPHWEPRRSYAGTYDEAWQTQRAPYLPTDFDARFFQLAPPELVCPGYLQGGETVEVWNATPSGYLACRLPAFRIQVTYVLDDRSEVRTANLDTVLLEPDAGRLVVVWRTVLRCDKKLLRVREIVAEQLGAA